MAQANEGLAPLHPTGNPSFNPEVPYPLFSGRPFTPPVEEQLMYASTAYAEGRGPPLCVIIVGSVTTVTDKYLWTDRMGTLPTTLTIHITTRDRRVPPPALSLRPRTVCLGSWVDIHSMTQTLSIASQSRGRRRCCRCHGTTAAQPQVLPHHPLLLPPHHLPLGRRTGLHGQTLLSKKKKFLHQSIRGGVWSHGGHPALGPNPCFGGSQGHAGRAPGDGIHHQNASRFHGGVSTPTVLQGV